MDPWFLYKKNLTNPKLNKLYINKLYKLRLDANFLFQNIFIGICLNIRTVTC